MTVLNFSIINVLCGAGGDASFAPQAYLFITSSVSIFTQAAINSDTDANLCKCGGHSLGF